MSATVQPSERLRELLNSDDVAFPAEPPVVRVEVEFGGFDDPTTFTLWLIVPDETPEEQLGWKQIQPFRDAAQEELRAQGLDYWPIVKVRTESEFAERHP